MEFVKEAIFYLMLYLCLKGDRKQFWGNFSLFNTHYKFFSPKDHEHE